MIELTLVRHGQTAFSRENRFCGAINPPLSEVGESMAKAFGEAYAGYGFQAVYASPRLRAQQTVAPLCALSGLSPQIADGLAEISYGEWEGLAHEEAKASHPDAYAYWAQDVASRGTPGGETAFAVASRAAPVIEQIKREHVSGKVLIVSHKATIRILVCALLGLDVRLFRDRIAQPVCAVTRFELRKSGPLLVTLGDVSHLPLALRQQEGT